MRTVKKATIVLATAVGLALAAASPAAAETDVAVTVTNGSMTITGTDGSDVITVDTRGDGGTSYRVTVTDAAGVVHETHHNGVTGTIVIDTGAGDDEIKLGHHTPTYAHRSLTIRSGTGLDSVLLRDVRVDQDLVLDGSGTTHLVRTQVGDDLMGTSGPGVMRTFVTSSTIDDLLQIRSTAGGNIHVEATGSETGRLRITGGNKVDRVQLYTNDLGRNPNINLAGGNDVLFLITDNTWTGNAPINLGAGEDQVLVDDQPEDGVLAAYRLGRMNLRLGANDDIAFIRAPLTVAGTIVDAQGGTDSLKAGGLENHPTSQATYRNFEDIQPGGPESAVQLDVSAAGDLRITSSGQLDYLNIENLGSGYGVYWRVTGDSGDYQRVVEGVSRHVTIDADTEYVYTGLNGGSSTFQGNVTVNAAAGHDVAIRIGAADIGGNLKIAGAGPLDINVTETNVDGMFDLRNTSGGFELELLLVTFGRTRIVGSPDTDAIWAYANVQLGTAPTINLGNGADMVESTDLSWAGRLTLLAGGGNDHITLDGQGGQHGRMRVLMGGGEDELGISGLANNGAGSILQGDGGDDRLRYLAVPTAATIRTFETVELTA
ncbi:MAG: hypothetical protein ACRBK7_01125 [Acidimicrobiales bacterium]